MDENIAILHQAIKSAIMLYAQMARTSEPPPESFIRDLCAVELHRNNFWAVRIEMPARDCAAWGIDRAKLQHLSRNFLIDMACFREHGGKSSDLLMLVEFKLWTNRDTVAKDVARLNELISLLPDNQGVMGYVVSVPHYENAAKVREALEDFAEHFMLSREVAASGEPFPTGADILGPSAGIAIIDVRNHHRS
ncbi:hypothetical protein [Bradyrhizobium erythrophlei]|jgi:hypothetical protein|nr:hypothetical protein [Bradyrhizobium erythrophlei]